MSMRFAPLLLCCPFACGWAASSSMRAVKSTPRSRGSVPVLQQLPEQKQRNPVAVDAAASEFHGKVVPTAAATAGAVDADAPASFSYGRFAQEYPFANNIAIATAK